MIDILIPSLGKRDLPALLENIKETTETPYHVFFICELKPHVPTVEGATMMYGRFGSPAKAINYAFKHTIQPYFLFGNDDFKFTKGWDKALDKMDDRVSVVALNDGDPRGETQWGTITLVKREYIDEQGGTENKGEVFHEGYLHNFVDTEFWHRAVSRNVADIAPDCKIIHEHPAFGFPHNHHKGAEQGFEQDAQLFTERQRQWLG